MDREAMIAALIFGGSGSGGGGGGGNEPFVVVFTKSGNTIVSDKTKTEIEAALTAGQAVFGLTTGEVFGLGPGEQPVIQLALMNGESTLFGNSYYFVSTDAKFGENNYPTFNTYVIYGPVISSTNEWNERIEQLTLPHATNANNGQFLGVDSNGRYVLSNLSVYTEINLATSYPAINTELATVFDNWFKGAKDDPDVISHDYGDVDASNLVSVAATAVLVSRRVPILMFVPDANNAFAITVSNACASVSPLTARSIGGRVNGVYRVYNEDMSEYELWNICIDITIGTDNIYISGYATESVPEE